MSKKKTRVISAFPGCGKTYCYNQYKDKLDILDVDTNEYIWLKDKEGTKVAERNPDFPNNLIKYVKENCGKVDIIFISSNETVRTALNEAGIEVTLVYPSREIKEVWLQRFIDRGDDYNFVIYMECHYNEMVSSMSLDESENVVNKIEFMSPTCYLSTHLEDNYQIGK